MVKYKHVPSGIIVEKTNNGYRTKDGYTLQPWIVQGKDWEEVEERKYLFETYEGVGKWERDDVWCVNGAFSLFVKYQISYSTYLDLSSHCKFFDTEQSANDYILNHKPCLSLNDVKHISNRPYFLERLTEIVKSKLAIP